MYSPRGTKLRWQRETFLCSLHYDPVSMRWADIFATLSLACIAFADKPLRCPDIFVLIYVSSLTRLWPVRKVGFSRAWHWFSNFGVLLYVCKIVQWEMLMEALHCLQFTHFSSSRIMDARYYGLFYENVVFQQEIFYVLIFRWKK